MNAPKPMKGNVMVISENTTTGTYQIDIFTTVSGLGTAAASMSSRVNTLNFSTTPAYRAALLRLLNLD